MADWNVAWYECMVIFHLLIFFFCCPIVLSQVPLDWAIWEHCCDSPSPQRWIADTRKLLHLDAYTTMGKTNNKDCLRKKNLLFCYFIACALRCDNGPRKLIGDAESCFYFQHGWTLSERFCHRIVINFKLLCFLEMQKLSVKVNNISSCYELGIRWACWSIKSNETSCMSVKTNESWNLFQTDRNCHPRLSKNSRHE